jgi:hypothetical protein
MATKRNVKKDIEYITYTIVHDCMSHLELDNKKSHDDVVAVISNAVQKRNELFSMVNNQKKGTRKEVRAYYREIYKNLLESADQSFETLSKAITK